MKKIPIPILSLLCAMIILTVNCSKKDDNITTTTTTTTTTTGSNSIKLNASGTVSYTYNSTSYSLSLDSAVWKSSAKTFLTITAHNLSPYSMTIIQVYDASGVKTSKDYVSNVSSTATSYAYITSAVDLSGNIYQASILQPNISAKVNLSQLSSTSIQGTFSGTLDLYSQTQTGSIVLSNGNINITIN